MTPKVHIALNVNNLQESLTFYRALWGVEPVKLRTGYAKFDIAEPAVNLTLNENPVKGLGARVTNTTISNNTHIPPG